jgi:DNA-binding XRE family transcriptional regulator
MFPLGRLLRRHREQARLTQEELAERAGVSARTISTTHIECKNRATRPNVMITIPMNWPRCTAVHDWLDA